MIDGLLEALTGTALVAHVAAVERGFLDTAMRRRGSSCAIAIVDTAELDREMRRLARSRRASTSRFRCPTSLAAWACPCTGRTTPTAMP